MTQFEEMKNLCEELGLQPVVESERRLILEPMENRTRQVELWFKSDGTFSGMFATEPQKSVAQFNIN